LAGKRWSFIDGAHPVQILGRGWAVPSDGGLWNDGTSATLRLNIADHADAPAVLSVEGETFSHRQRVQVFAGETQLAEFILPQGMERSFAIPPDILASGQSLRLEFPDADIPYNVGFNDDRRTLALRLKELEWRPVAAVPAKAPPLFGAFIVHPVPGILRIWGMGAVPDARFRLNGAMVFSCPVQEAGTWSAWLAVSPEQARGSRLKLDIYQMDGAKIDVAGVDQFVIGNIAAAEIPLLLHPILRSCPGDVREIVEAPEVSVIERIERRLYAMMPGPAAKPLAPLPEEPSFSSMPLGSGPETPAVEAPSAAVIYNAAARLLTVHVTCPERADEVRVLGDGGAELARVRVSGQEVRAAMICAPDALPHSLTIRNYIGTDCVKELILQSEDIQQAGLEVAVLALSDTEISGAFWAREGTGQDWQMICHDTALGQFHTKEGRVLHDLSLIAVPFRMPLPDQDIQPAHGDAPGDRICIVPNAAGAPTPRQSPLTLSRVQLKGLRRPAPELAALRNAHKGKAAWIIGNGPSVRLEDLATIPPGDVVFAFNRFYLSYPDHPLREDYVVSADAQMIDDFGQEMIDQSGGLPLFCRPRETLSHLKGRFVTLMPGDSALPVFSTNPAHFVSVGGSSVFVALQMAYYMGLRDIRLYGMDYSFNTVLSHDLGNEALMAVNDGNHFIENYRGDRPWYPPSWADIATGFLNARIAFELDGGHIVNATRGGRLETFQRLDIGHLLAGQR